MSINIKLALIAAITVLFFWEGFPLDVGTWLRISEFRQWWWV